MTQDTQQIRIWWEDMQPGQVFALGETSPTEAEILAFARQFDPQPFHLDEQAARASVFGSLCASGWHTCAMAMRLTVDNLLRHTGSLGSPGVEKVQWPTPVFPGDVLSLRYTILESRPLRSRPGIGLVRGLWEMDNQKGQAVLRMEGLGMFRMRPAD